MEHLTTRNWKDILKYIGERKSILLIGDNLTIVKDPTTNEEQTLIKYINTKLYNHVVDYCTRNNQEIILELPTHDLIMDMSWINYSEAFKDTKAGSLDCFVEKIIDDLDKDNLNYEKIHQLLTIDRFNIILSSSYSSAYKEIVRKWAIKNNRTFIYGELQNGSLMLSHILLNGKHNQASASSRTGAKNEILFINLMGVTENNNERALTNLAVTEEDMILFVMSWISAFSNSSLNDIKTKLNNSLLLSLGCNIPSWAFRFIWYVIKNPCGEKENPFKAFSLRPLPYNENVKRFITKDKSAFLINADDTSRFIDCLVENCIEKGYNNSDIKDDFPPDQVDIFVSYASEDRDIIINQLLPILEALKEEKGYTYWYDKNELRPANDWESEIKYAIRHSSVFLTLQTSNSYTVASSHNYRYLTEEWSLAKEIHKRHKNLEDNKDFILPIIKGEPGKKELYKTFDNFQHLNMQEECFPDKLKENIDRILKQVDRATPNNTTYIIN